MMSKLEERIVGMDDPVEIYKTIALMLSKIALSLDSITNELIYLNDRLEK